jgi:protein-tyrosine phosphatase
MNTWQASLDQVIRRRFGRKQGVVRAARARLGLLAGRFDVFQAPVWGRVGRLVFVCKGNLCRSAYAEAVARSLGASAASFGLEAGEGRAADATAIRMASARRIDLSGHRSRRHLELSGGDLLVGMEPAHLQRLEVFARETSAQATLLGLWAQPVRPHVEDPFGLSPEYFETCLAVIDDAVRQLVAQLRRGAP